MSPVFGETLAMMSATGARGEADRGGVGGRARRRHAGHYTREGHLPDLSDAPPGQESTRGASLRWRSGPMGRILNPRRGRGHDIIPDLLSARQ